MKNYYDAPVSAERQKSFIETGGANAFLRQVYANMGLGLLITAMTAWYVSGNATILSYLIDFQTGSLNILGWIVMFAPLGLVIFLSARIHKMSVSAAATTFAVYSLVNGISLSFIFLVYTQASIFKTFFIAAAMFGAMTLIGFTTKVDLSKFRSILFMGLIGIIIASLVNMFLQSGPMDYIISFIGVVIFAGLTAYDTQKLMQIGLHADPESDSTRKTALMGALALYLDFINLFLFLLRFFGSRE